MTDEQRLKAAIVLSEILYRDLKLDVRKTANVQANVGKSAVECLVSVYGPVIERLLELAGEVLPYDAWARDLRVIAARKLLGEIHDEPPDEIEAVASKYRGEKDQ